METEKTKMFFLTANLICDESDSFEVYYVAENNYMAVLVVNDLFSWIAKRS